MKLLLLYGSPAVGKLTVANEIARKTDYKVFHNHLMIDAVEPIFEFGTASFWKLVHSFRIEVVAEAARAGQNLIYTFCYAKDSDDSHVRLIAKTVEENGGKIRFVLLIAEKSEIEKRVSAESRKQYGKLKDIETLREVWGKYDLFSPVPERKSLIIDNTNLSAADAAVKITDYYKF